MPSRLKSVRNRTARSVALSLVRAYQVALSPLAGGACRFSPTCSAYALEALEQHPFLTAASLTIRRLGRCHPWGGWGLDPVPDPRPTGTDRLTPQ